MKNYLIAVSGLLFFNSIVFAAENPHEMTKLKSSESCLSCHLTQPKQPPIKEGRFTIPDMTAYKGDGVALCATCHDPKRASHMIGRKVEIALPAELPLAKDRKIVCLTCHYTHGNFYTEQPRANINAFDKLFNTERMHNSFLLRLNNTDGEFCLLCHQAKP
jgi:nitrate/TMAO reductase-like tetraheme cytochrome c subunit